MAQDAASACRVFEGEVYYDTSQGLPFFQSIFGQPPALTFLKQQFANAALTVPEVASAQVFISGFTDRGLTGQVQITSAEGVTVAANFSASQAPDPLPFGT